jgi:hypothetical protein
MSLSHFSATRSLLRGLAMMETTGRMANFYCNFRATGITAALGSQTLLENSKPTCRNSYMDASCTVPTDGVLFSTDSRL